MYALPYLIVLRLHRAALDARRRDHTWRFLAWSVVAGACAAVLVGVAALLALLMFQVRLWYLALPIVMFFVVPPLEPLITRHVLVPLGAAKSAYWIARRRRREGAARRRPGAATARGGGDPGGGGLSAPPRRARGASPAGRARHAAPPSEPTSAAAEPARAPLPHAIAASLRFASGRA